MFKTLIVLLSLLFSSLSHSQVPVLNTSKKYPDTVKAGIYIISIYDINFPGNQLNIDFYVWFNYKNDSLHLSKSFEVVNAKDFKISGESREKYDTVIYETFRCNAVLKKKWDVTDFPFDYHELQILIEDIDLDLSKLVFIPDIKGTKIDKNVDVSNWWIKNSGVRVEENFYETTYGDPTLASNDYSKFSRLNFYFTLERKGTGLFLKLFVGLFIAVLISFLTFLINPLNLDPRFGLPVGAIFAAIASEYVINSTLPETTTLTLVDILHNISFIYIFLCILLSTISLHLFERDKKEVSKKLDRYSFIILISTYFITVILLLTVK